MLKSSTLKATAVGVRHVLFGGGRGELVMSVYGRRLPEMVCKGFRVMGVTGAELLNRAEQF